MTRRFILGAALAAVLLSPVAVSAQARQDFQMINQTGYQIDEIYVSSSGNANWGRDLLGNDVLRNGQVFNVTFPQGVSECMFDIKIIYEDRDESELRQVNLCNVSRIFLTWDDAAGDTRFRTE